jgi:hypothetical protein
MARQIAAMLLGVAHHHGVQRQVHRDQHDRDPDGLAEPAQEHRRQRGQKHQGDHELVPVHEVRRVGVLQQVRRGIRRRQGHRDQEVGRGEAQQYQDEDLARPPGTDAFEHGQRPSP